MLKFKNVFTFFIILIIFSFIYTKNPLVRIAIFYTGTLSGEIESCPTCRRIAKTGGLARRFTAFKKYGKKYNYKLILDAGSIFCVGADVNKNVNLIHKKAKLICQIYDLLEYDICNFGGYDLILPSDFIKTLNDSANFEFISSNIVDKNTSDLVFKPYTIKTVSGIRIGIIGVSSKFGFEPKDYIILDPVECINNILSEVKNKVDYIILLADLTNDDLMKIANLSDIDLILRAGSIIYRNYLEKVKNCFVSNVGDKGKKFGIIELNIKDIRDEFIDVSWMKLRIDNIDKQINKYRKNLEKANSTRASSGVIERLKEEKRELEDQLKLKRNWYELKLITLDDKFNESEYIKEMIKNYKNSLDNVR